MNTALLIIQILLIVVLTGLCTWFVCAFLQWRHSARELLRVATQQVKKAELAASRAKISNEDMEKLKERISTIEFRNLRR